MNHLFTLLICHCTDAFNLLDFCFLYRFVSFSSPLMIYFVLFYENTKKYSRKTPDESEMVFFGREPSRTAWFNRRLTLIFACVHCTILMSFRLFSARTPPPAPHKDRHPSKCNLIFFFVSRFIYFSNMSNRAQRN